MVSEPFNSSLPDIVSSGDGATRRNIEMSGLMEKHARGDVVEIVERRPATKKTAVQQVQPAVSVVVPVYYGARYLRDLYRRISQTLATVDGGFEVIFVEDGGKDESWDVLKELRREHPEHIKILRLSRNFGQHNALMCGFSVARGAVVVTLDDDLQFYPEDIPLLLQEIEKGFHVVYGYPAEKQHHSLRNLASLILQMLFRKIFGLPSGFRTSSFRALRGEIVREMLRYRTPFPHVSAMAMSITRNAASLPVRHAPRADGKSTYSFRKLLKLTFNLVIHYSSLPLEYSCLFGAVISLMSFCVGCWFLLKKLIWGVSPPGWTSLMVMLSLMTGTLLMVLAVIGEYLIRVLGEVSSRPQYVVVEKEL